MSERIWVHRYMSKGKSGMKYQFRLRRERGAEVCGHFARLFDPMSGTLQDDYEYFADSPFAGRQPSYNWVLFNRPTS